MNFLGIEEVRQSEVTIRGVHLYSGFLLGGERIYEADTKKEKKLQDLDLTVPWYITSSGTETYMNGTMSDKEVKKLDEENGNELLPALIWRSSQGRARVFSVAGEYMEDKRIGKGILSAVLFKSGSYTVYPVINAQNLVLVSFPTGANENVRTIEKIYGRSMLQLESQMNEMSCKLGISLMEDTKLSAKEKAEEIRKYLKRQNISYQIGAAVVRPEDLTGDASFLDDALFQHLSCWACASTGIPFSICFRRKDMATCLAMFTNFSATIIFISRIEMRFQDRYKAYADAIIGGRGQDIRNTKNRMFRCLSGELLSLCRLQFIITTIVFLLFTVLIPQMGLGGSTMRIYNCLAVGYFILFLMYAEILFLYYFNDITGALITALLFCLVTFLGSLFATHQSEIWYGIGLVLGALAGFVAAYLRLRWMEKNLYAFTFCDGDLIRRVHKPKPLGM